MVEQNPYVLCQKYESEMKRVGIIVDFLDFFESIQKKQGNISAVYAFTAIAGFCHCGRG
jgi:hypothetical protein